MCASVHFLQWKIHIFMQQCENVCWDILCVSIAMQLHKMKLLISNYIIYSQTQFLINWRDKQMSLDKVQNCPQGCNYGMQLITSKAYLKVGYELIVSFQMH